MAKQTNYLRGQLLKYLQTLFPEGIPEQVILHAYYDYNRQQDILRALAYLCEKEYVEKKEANHPYREDAKVRWWKITAKGIDLLEGAIEKDAGVLLSD